MDGILILSREVWDDKKSKKLVGLSIWDGVSGGDLSHLSNEKCFSRGASMMTGMNEKGAVSTERFRSIATRIAFALLALQNVIDLLAERQPQVWLRNSFFQTSVLTST